MEISQTRLSLLGIDHLTIFNSDYTHNLIESKHNCFDLEIIAGLNKYARKHANALFNQKILSYLCS